MSAPMLQARVRCDHPTRRSTCAREFVTIVPDRDVRHCVVAAERAGWVLNIETGKAYCPKHATKANA